MRLTRVSCRSLIDRRDSHRAEGMLWDESLDQCQPEEGDEIAEDRDSENTRPSSTGAQFTRLTWLRADSNILQVALRLRSESLQLHNL